MSYVALARKWRPKRFAEMIGQEHVRRALSNALGTDRVHHAFLFTGTRGVGKTTIARILAKCLNCERGVSADPCGECASCREIDGGRFVDLIEVDAASRTKVDDTRELLDNVQYAPTRGRYKVYLIDEVHMLSTSSFNALLKTLEEPPPHVKFLLATTDPQKLPATVLSRCLQFNLKRLPLGAISDRMREILEQERIEFEPAALRLLAQAADGSVRDGLSLLDQLLAFGAGRATEADARAMLGTVARDHVVTLVERLAGGDARELVRTAQELEQWAPDYAQLLDELAALLTRIALKQVVGDYQGDELYAPELLERLARELAPEDVQLYYQTAIVGRRDLPLAPDPRTGFEMTLLRMIAFRPEGQGEGQAMRAAPRGPARVSPASAAVSASAPRGAAPAALSSTVAAGVVPSTTALSSTVAAGVVPSTTALSSTPATALSSSGATAGPASGASVPSDRGAAGEGADAWAAVLAQLDLQGAARQLASHCTLLGRQGGVVRLALDPRNQFVRTRAQEEKLAQALARHYGEPVRLEFVMATAGVQTPAEAKQRATLAELEAARQALDSDPTVRALQERFGASVLPESVRPVK